MADGRQGMPRHELLGRGSVALVAAYALCLGGTFDGILDPLLRQVSLGLLTLGAALWLAAEWRGARGRALATPLDPALLAWAAAYVISTLPHPSGRAAIGCWYAGLYAGCWFLLSGLLRRGMPGRWITDGALLTAIPLMLLALAQVLPWFPRWLEVRDLGVIFAPPRPPSAVGNPNVLGTILALLLPFGLARARTAPRRPDRILAAGWVGGALAVLYLTTSRGAWLAAGAALLTLAVSAPAGRRSLRDRAVRWKGLSRRRRAVGLGTAAALAILVAALTLVSLRAFDTPRRETGARLSYYRVALDDLIAHPLTGTGPFTFGLSLLGRLSVPPLQPQAHAHNLILNIAAELGLPGLAAFALTVLLILRVWQRAYRSSLTPSERWNRAACLAALAAFFAHGLVDVPAMVPGVMLLTLAVLATGIMVPVEHQAQEEAFLRPLTTCVIVTTLWGILLVAGWWSARIYADYVQGERWLLAGRTQEGAARLEAVAQRVPWDALYQAQWGYAEGLLASSGDPSAARAGIAAYERALDLEAPHAAWWANLAALYWQVGEGEQAVAALHRAVEAAPEAPDLWLNLGLVLERQGDPAAAAPAYRRVLDLDPSWAQAAFWNETPFRRAQVATASPGSTPYQQAKALWQQGQHAEAIHVLKATLEHDPAQPGPYAALARLYVSGGDPAHARQYLAAARVLVHVDHDRAWIHLVEACLALADGDAERSDAHLQAARTLLRPPFTGTPVVYGREVAQYQFLRQTVPGTLLPQLVALGPQPELLDLLALPLGALCRR